MIQELGDHHSPNLFPNTRHQSTEEKAHTFFQYFSSWSGSPKVNRNKKSVALSFKHAESLTLLNKIIETSDVVVENYIPGTLKKYKLDYPTLSRKNPGLIYASITGMSKF